MFELKYSDGTVATAEDVKIYSAGDFGRDRREPEVRQMRRASVEVHHLTVALMRESGERSYALCLRRVLSNPKNADLKVRFALEG
jgi:hypothetical protein